MINNYYAVYKGFKPGIYSNWKDCQSQINKYSGSIYKKFNNLDEAKYFVKYGQIKSNDDLKYKNINNISTNNLNNDILFIYTDGSCINNGKKDAKGGIGIHFSNNQFKDISFKFSPENDLDKPTNNKMELLAIFIAISLVEPKILEYNKVLIFTDSKYSIDCLTRFISNWVKNDWKTKNNQPIANQKIIKSIYYLIQKYPHKIDFEHINSHTGKTDIHSLGNQKADHLALTAALS